MRGVVVLFACFIVGCLDIRNEQFACADGPCPSGFHCWSDSVCRAMPEVDGPDVGPDPDAGTDALMDGTVDARTPDASDATPARRALDLIIVVDDSASMAEEQALLGSAFEDLVLGLTTGSIGEESFEPITDIQFGVVSTDMGSGGFVGPTSACSDNAMFGDDAIVREETLQPLPHPFCEASYPGLVQLESGFTSRFIDDFRCKAELGIGGCGFEQQLEAMMKAVTPSAEGPLFHGGTTGHGDGANMGIVRDDTVVAVLIVSDEEDCSAADPALFERESAVYTMPYTQRCIDYHSSGALHATSRYVDALQRLRRGEPGRIVFGGIVGIPLDADASDYDAMLADPRMVPRTTSMTGAPEAVCSGGERREAGASPRYVETAKRLTELGSRATLGSICQSNYRDFFERYLLEISRAFER